MQVCRYKSCKMAATMILLVTIAFFLCLSATIVFSQTLIWSDEFDGPAGSSPNSQKWTYDIGGTGWGNNELEYYTNSRDNSALDGNGNLRITATKEGASKFTCWNGPCQYTSARLLTKGLFSTTYGRIEARIKVPHGKGIWPAFWTLGTDIGDIGWPTCGEIDIMEVRGSDPKTVSAAIHGPGYSGGQALSGSYSTPDGRWLSDEFHVFVVDWSAEQIVWSLDNHVYFTRTSADLPPGAPWTFNHDFFILLNFAVGGNFDGDPNVNTPFPQSMIVDYVRVYRI